MSKYHISQFDAFFISYDEANAEENWAKLQAIAPWAQRVHGVKGFDAAHKKCAELSTTDRFVTIDGDNVVDPAFFDLEFEIPEHLTDCVLSWAGRNSINGLIYGNGGLKLWTREFVLNMRTHEHTETKEEATDFCWDPKYVQLNGVFSDTCPNGSAFQAFRAGFREGVKMTLDRGRKVNPTEIKDVVHHKNLKRLLIWASVGSDAPHGCWAIYGTRLGIYMSTLTDWDISQVSDYDWFNTLWLGYKDTPSHELIGKLSLLGDQIKKGTDMEIAFLYPDQSKFFKAVYEAPVRTLSPLATEIEVDSGIQV